MLFGSTTSPTPVVVESIATAPPLDGDGLCDRGDLKMKIEIQVLAYFQRQRLTEWGKAGNGD